MGNIKVTDNKKIELSLSAIMFFSPLIHNIINKNTKLSYIDKSFIKGFIKLGYLNIFLLLSTITLQVIFYLTKIGVAEILSTIITIILTISLIIGSVYAISNKTIIKLPENQNIDGHNTSDKQDEKTKDKLEILLNYIPIYNIYLRYKNHNFENPDMILKESILRWSLFVATLLIFQNQTLNLTIILILMIRIISLINGIEISTSTKQKLNKLFKKNPEEIRCYISGSIYNVFNKKSLSDNIKNQKDDYNLLFKSTNKQIIFEYAILDILIVGGLYMGYITKNWALITAILFIAARYILMVIYLKHLPHLPLIKEISSIFFKPKIK